jgi:hypothetical protein
MLPSSVFIVVLFLALFKKAACSAGDMNQDFQLCTANCMARLDCPIRSDHYKWTQKPCFEYVLKLETF